MKTLLERAKMIPTHSKAHKTYTREDLELSVAYLKGELSLTQIGKVLNFPNRNYSNQVYTFIMMSLKYGTINGLLELTVKK